MTAVPLLEHSPPEEAFYGKHRQPAVRSSTREIAKRPRAEMEAGVDYRTARGASKV
jgi:hypothetical protein